MYEHGLFLHLSGLLAAALCNPSAAPCTPKKGPGGRPMASALVQAANCTDRSPSGFALNGASVECSALQPFCGHISFGCSIANRCPETCGACSSQQFCDAIYTGFTVNGQDARCAQLSSFCWDAVHGRNIRILCPEQCGCGYCPPSPPPAPPLAPSCSTQVDLAFVVDRSGSMLAFYQQALAMVRELILNFAVDESLARVALVGFNDYAETQCALTGNSTEVLRSLDNSLERGVFGFTNISDGFRAGLAELRGPRARPGAALQLLLLLTDGTQSPSFGGDEAAIASAELVKAEGVEVFALGFGGASPTSLDSMATHPASRYAMYNTSLIQLQMALSRGMLCTTALTPLTPPAPPSPPEPSLPPSAPPSPPLPPPSLPPPSPPPPSPPLPSPPSPSPSPWLPPPLPPFAPDHRFPPRIPPRAPPPPRFPPPQPPVPLHPPPSAVPSSRPHMAPSMSQPAAPVTLQLVSALPPPPRPSTPATEPAVDPEPEPEGGATPEPGPPLAPPPNAPPPPVWPPQMPGTRLVEFVAGSLSLSDTRRRSLQSAEGSVGDATMAGEMEAAITSLAASLATAVTHIEVRPSGGRTFQVRVDGACGPVHGLLTGPAFLPGLVQRLDLAAGALLVIDSPFVCIVQTVPLPSTPAPPSPLHPSLSAAPPKAPLFFTLVPSPPWLVDSTIEAINAADPSALHVPLLVGLIAAGVLMMAACAFNAYHHRRRRFLSRSRIIDEWMSSSRATAVDTRQETAKRGLRTVNDEPGISMTASSSHCTHSLASARSSPVYHDADGELVLQPSAVREPARSAMNIHTPSSRIVGSSCRSVAPLSFKSHSSNAVAPAPSPSEATRTKPPPSLPPLQAVPALSISPAASPMPALPIPLAGSAACVTAAAIQRSGDTPRNITGGDTTFLCKGRSRSSVDLASRPSRCGRVSPQPHGTAVAAARPEQQGEGGMDAMHRGNAPPDDEERFAAMRAAFGTMREPSTEASPWRPKPHVDSAADRGVYLPSVEFGAPTPAPSLGAGEGVAHAEEEEDGGLDVMHRGSRAIKGRRGPSGDQNAADLDEAHNDSLVSMGRVPKRRARSTRMQASVAPLPQAGPPLATAPSAASGKRPSMDVIFPDRDSEED